MKTAIKYYISQRKNSIFKLPVIFYGMTDLMNKIPKGLQLGLSAIIVISVSLVYGGNPSLLLPYVFGFEVEAIDLKNMLRAIMGLYIAFGCYWVYGLVKPKYWRSATISNVLFMGGLAAGRVISTIFDGVSDQFMVGLVLEAIFLIWGIYLLKTDTSSIEK